MTDKIHTTTTTDSQRPVFPQRVIITGGMPYGNKDLHFGHMGGLFVQADIFARFLRDRIGRENVIFVSGTDCYGSPIVEYYRQATASGEFTGSIEEFVQFNHQRQVKAMHAYHIDLNLFAASSFGRSGEIHREVCGELINLLYAHGHLEKLTTRQFYDTEQEIFLNGRQVVGQCPILGCASEKGYADECSLGHQYEPMDLINPRSTVSGKKPEMREVSNWYFKLPQFTGLLEEWVTQTDQIPGNRQFVGKSISEFFEPPSIYVVNKEEEALAAIAGQLPPHSQTDSKSNSMRLIFNNLQDRETACTLLTSHGIRYRTGKTLVPFRLTGNVEWGLPVPRIEDVSGLTFWVWPESLWAPLSFTATYLEQQGRDKEEWRQWWQSANTRVYQFIGEDNIYFYGIAEMAMFMAMQGKEPRALPAEGEFQLPELIVNKHILFLDKKASSSGKVKPPMAADLLAYYTADQLRAHFFSLGLSLRSVGFKPKPLDPKADARAGDPVMKEGNLLSNVFNRAVRTCFYTMQSNYEGKIPVGEPGDDIAADARTTILDFEAAMYRHEFHQAMAVLDNFIRRINKHWEGRMREIKESGSREVRSQALIDLFHMVRVATVLMHPIAPEGTEKIREYLNLGEEFWSWERIFDPIYAFMNNPAEHQFKWLEPRVDFFEKHPSQVTE